MGVALLLRDTCNAEVEQFGLRAADHVNVGRLDVTVHHAVAVSVGQGVGDALGDTCRLPWLGPPAVGQKVAQIAPLQALHGNVDALL